MVNISILMHYVTGQFERIYKITRKLCVTTSCIPQLVKIQRTGETSWESKSVMSVSFATLISPTKVDPPEEINLRMYNVLVL